MVKISHLNPEAPRQVAVRILMDSVQPMLSQALTAVFQGAGHPLTNLRKFIKRASGQLAVAAATAGAAGGASSGVAIWKASLRNTRSLGYLTGLVTLPLAPPLVGGVLGLALGVGGAAYFIARVRKSEGLAMAKLHAHLFSVMLYSEGVEETYRQSILEEIKDRLVSTGLKSDVVESLFVRAPLRIEELDVEPDRHELETLRAVLTNAWQLASGKGEPAPALEHTFVRLCRRLNLGDEVTTIKAQATEAIEKQSARIGAAIEAARHIGSDFDSATIGAALEQLISLDPLTSAKERRMVALHRATDVAAAAGALAAVASGSGQLLPIIGQAYAALRAVVSGDEGASKRLQTRALELLKQLGVKPEDANRFMNPLIEVLDVDRANKPEPPETTDVPVRRPRAERSN